MSLVSKAIGRLFPSMTDAPEDSPTLWEEILGYVDFGEPLEVYAVDANGVRVSDVAPVSLSRDGGSITAPGVDLTAIDTSRVAAAHIRIPNSDRYLRVDITGPTVVYVGQSLSFNDITLCVEEG